MSTPSRGLWSSRLGFVLAAAGSAIGLGNIWKFPYTAGKNGGAFFLFAYVGAVLVIGLPILMAEIAIGRSSRRNPVGAFRALRPGTAWVVPGWMGVVSGLLILAFYGVVAGWALDFVYLSLTGAFSGPDDEAIRGVFGALVDSPGRQVFWQAVFMALTVGIVAGGVSGGIERGSRLMMPALFLMLLGLLVYALTLPGRGEAIEFLLKPRWEDVSVDGLLAALGQAFFSLSLGMGAMITYGSYLREDADIPWAATAVVLSDTTIGVLAGFVIFPLVFSFGLEPSAGPGLIFQTLPVAFAKLPGAAVLGGVFFVLLVFAALTSAISLLEVVVAYLVDEWGWSRGSASVRAGTLIFAIGTSCAVDSAWIDRFDGLTSNYLLPIGGLLIALFAGWILPAEVQSREIGHGRLAEVWRFMVRWVSPAAVAIVFLSLLLG